MGQSPSRSDGAPPNPRSNVRWPTRPRPLSAIFDRPSASTVAGREDAPSRRHSGTLSSLLSSRPRLPERDAADDELAHPSRRLRLSRSGSSFTNSFSNLISRNRHMQSNTSHIPSGQSSSLQPENLSDNLPETGSTSPPQIHLPELDLPFEVPSFNAQSSAPSTSPQSTQHNTTEARRTRDLEATAGRATPSRPDRIPSAIRNRGFRNMTAPFRRHRQASSPQDDQAAIISSVLHFAASATAASLMGENEETSRARSRDNQDADDFESDNNNFQGFLQALRSGSLERALGGAVRSSGDSDARLTNPNGALDFFRMFRLGTGSSSRRRNADSPGPGSHENSGEGSAGPQQATPGDGEGEILGRMVPILIVGIRALHEDHSDNPEGSREVMPAFLDAISNLPPAIGLDGRGDAVNEGRLRRRRNGLRLPVNSRRRSSLGSLNFFPTNRDAVSSLHGPEVEAPTSSSVTAENVEMQSGSNAPPTTPSSAPLSTFSSGTSSPTSSRSTAPPQPVSPARPAPRDSDAGRFGSGSSRRNGVLMDPLDTPIEGHRSWVIYILGGSYPENHPILSTPSLFTDSPTYEDMMLLSTLLGPAKPPVANEEDVVSAGGLFTINIAEGSTTAVQVDGNERLVMRPEERCLICLSNYETGEEVRRLVKCGHIYHRECIDLWLTTGRNSCPLCRGQGVDEKHNQVSLGEQAAAQPPEDPLPSS